MNRYFVALCMLAGSTSLFAADVGVSITVGQPGFYGRIDIGNVPPPQLIYQRPIIIDVPVVVVQQRPIYLHVPPGHAKKWRKHCREYSACGQQVYFVQNNWYSNVYVPYYRDRKGRREGNDEQRGRDDDRDNGKGNGKSKKH